MKTVIILIIAVLFSFGAKAQLSADSISKPKFVGVEYMFIDTFTQGSEGDVDTFMYSEIVSKNNLPDAFKGIPDPILANNDTAYRLMDLYKFDWLYSVKIVRYRKVSKFVEVKEAKPVKFQMYDLAKKRYQLDYDLELFWNHPKVKAITDEE